jgi:flavorubredoxin
VEWEIVDGVYWVGVHLPEWNISFNAFLLMDEKNVLIDATAPYTADKVLNNIKSLVEPTEIDYIILTHSDIDHAGGLQKIWPITGGAEVVTSSNYGEVVIDLLGVKPRTRILEEGSIIDLGKKKLTMVPAPFLCTPDSIFIYDKTDKILFSADAFGTYTKEWTLFADRDMTEDMRHYNEVKFGHRINVTHAAINVRKMKLDVEIIAPGHGLMLRDAQGYIEKAVLMML